MIVFRPPSLTVTPRSDAEVLGGASVPATSLNVSIWWMSPGDIPPKDMIRYESMLDPYERQRADRFVDHDARREYVLAHSLLRIMLARHIGTPPAALRFRTQRYGKPELDEPYHQPAMTFSLSHTRGLVACAIADAGDVGLDVEQMEDSVPALDVARRFFAPSEWSLLNRVSVAQRGRLFFQLWTLKEALVKATGEGLHRPLASFAFSLNPIRVRFGCSTDQTSWSFAQIWPGARHVLSIALRGPRPRLARFGFHQVAPATLLTGDI